MKRGAKIRNILTACTLLLAALASPSVRAQLEVKELPTRPGVTLRFIYAKAQQPIASAVLFQGGSGSIGIRPNGTTRNPNFLSGGADRFVRSGITVAVLDTPSDRRSLDMFRHSSEHAEDVAAVIAFLRKESDRPVWAIGTSNGSLSAASSAEFLGDRGPDGIVLTSSVTNYPRPNAHPITEAALDRITVSTLFVHHRYDACRSTPFDAIPPLLKKMTRAKKVDLIAIEGGEDRPNSCDSGHHQYVGVEQEVTQKIADWIRANQ